MSDGHPSHLPSCMSLAGGSTFDLREDENGVRWDVRKGEDRDRARRRILKERPFLVVGSPPCTEFCSVQALNQDRFSEEERQWRRVEAKVHLGFALQI